MDEFISRRLGPELAEYAISSLVRGICAGDSKQVSVHFIAKYLHQLEQETGRITLGAARDWVRGWGRAAPKCPEEELDIVRRARAERWAIWGLENGLETLIETLRDSVTSSGVEVRLGTAVEKVTRDGAGLRVVTGAEEVACDEVVMAAPAFQTAGMVADLCPELAELLAAIPFVDVAVVNIEYRGRVLDHQGFGFLVPSSQPEPILGCIYDTCTFPQGNRTLLTVMVGGAWYRDMVGAATEEEVGARAVATVSRVLGISAAPVRVHCAQLPRCIAQYTVGHTARLGRAREILARHKLPLHLAGSSYDGPGINDTIMSAKLAVIRR